jgi:hypothetical protein
LGVLSYNISMVDFKINTTPVTNEQLVLSSKVSQALSWMRSKFYDPLLKLRNEVIQGASDAVSAINATEVNLTNTINNLPSTVSKKMSSSFEESVSKAQQERMNNISLAAPKAKLMQVVETIKMAKSAMEQLVININSQLTNLQGEFKDWSNKALPADITDTDVNLNNKVVSNKAFDSKVVTSDLINTSNDLSVIEEKIKEKVVPKL